MTSVSDKILNEYISHGVDITRLEADLQRIIKRYLERIKKELSEKIVTLSEESYRSRKYQKLLKAVNESLASEFSNLTSISNGYLEEFAGIESEFVNSSFNTVLKTTIFSKSLNPVVLKELATKSLIQGAVNADWWKRMSESTQNKFSDQIALGMSQGEALSDILQRIRGTATGKFTTYIDKAGKTKRWMEFKGGIMDITTRDAEALARTALQTVSANVREKMFKQYPKVIEGFQQNSTLDNRTTLHCSGYDGLTWDLDHNPVGHSFVYVPLPAHWRCRSNMVPWLKKWSEIDSRIKDDFPESTRASMDGKVPGKMKYENWFDTISEKRQLEILGPGRLKLYQNNNLGFTDMIDQKGNPLTIIELKRKYNIK